MRKEYPYKYVSLDQLSEVYKFSNLNLIIGEFVKDNKRLYFILNGEPSDNQKHLNYSPQGLTVFELVPKSGMTTKAIIDVLIKQIVKQIKDSAKINGNMPDLELLEELISSLPNELFEINYHFILELYKKLLAYLDERYKKLIKKENFDFSKRIELSEQDTSISKEIKEMLNRISHERTNIDFKRKKK